MSVSQDIQRVLLHLERRSTQLLTLLVAETDARLKMRTPVDTGRARASWAIGVGQINTAVAPDTVKGQPVAAAEPSVPAVTIGDVVYLTNALPYARRLEYGWSKQAPNGMVRLTAQEAPQIIAALTAQVRT